MKAALVFLAASAFAQVTISEIDALRLENVSLRLDLMSKELEAIHRERNELIRKVCASAAIPIEECTIDAVKRTVAKKAAK